MLKIITISFALFINVFNMTYSQDTKTGYGENTKSVVYKNGSDIISTIPLSNEKNILPQTDHAVNIADNVNNDNSIHNWVLYFTETGSVFRDVSFADQQTGYISTELGAVYKTTNGGLNWTSKLNLGFPYYWYGIDALSPDTVVISGFLNNGTGLIRWTFDGGNTWTGDIVLGSNRLDRIHFFDQNNGVAFLGELGGVYHTTNGGKTPSSWSYVQVVSGFLDGNYDFQGTGTIYATGTNIVKSTNLGVNWTVSPTADNVVDQGIDFLDDDINYGITGGGEISPTLSGWVHRTTNGGANWGARQETFPFPIRAVKLFNPNSGIAVGGNVLSEAGGIYATTNGGLNWTEDIVTSAEMFSITVVPVPNTDSMDVWCVGTTGQSAGYSGKAYKTRIAGLVGIGIHNINQNVPAKFVLDQNYPNPFNPSTVISYDLKEAGFITLKIYDINGKEISTLVNQKQNAGNYSVKVDGTHLSSGEYFYKLKSNDYSETKKMIILK